MPVICGYKVDGDALTIVMPVSKALIEDSINVEHVAKMAGELAKETAEKAVRERRQQYEEETP